jgi:hypothetical protein
MVSRHHQGPCTIHDRHRSISRCISHHPAIPRDRSVQMATEVTASVHLIPAWWWSLLHRRLQVRPTYILGGHHLKIVTIGMLSLSSVLSTLSIGRRLHDTAEKCTPTPGGGYSTLDPAPNHTRRFITPNSTLTPRSSAADSTLYSHSKDAWKNLVQGIFLTRSSYRGAGVVHVAS